jgi:hypothetical protein
MALQGFLHADDAAVHFDFPSAYARIAVATCVTNEWRVIVNIYADATARGLNAAPVLQKEYVTAPLSGDLWPAIYGFLKLQPLFEGWVDV